MSSTEKFDAYFESRISSPNGTAAHVMEFDQLYYGLHEEISQRQLDEDKALLNSDPDVARWPQLQRELRTSVRLLTFDVTACRYAAGLMRQAAADLAMHYDEYEAWEKACDFSDRIHSKMRQLFNAVIAQVEFTVALRDRLEETSPVIPQTRLLN